VGGGCLPRRPYRAAPCAAPAPPAAVHTYTPSPSVPASPRPRWRQLSEPNDQVVWVDLLTRREFEAGFGSHTPMFSGQTKCVRYYMNFER
jgi:hypothetical protein